MGKNYVLTVRDAFDRAAQDQAVELLKTDLAEMTTARVVSEQPFIGTMVIAVDDDATLEKIREKHKSRFHFEREGQIRAGK